MAVHWVSFGLSEEASVAGVSEEEGECQQTGREVVEIQTCRAGTGQSAQD